ncbi:MAG: hypothetical protein ACC651_17665 [Candidatus Scalindua sp.]
MAINIEKLTKKEKVSYWQDQVSAWEKSGLKQAEYCRKHDLKIRNFGYWKRRLHKASEAVTFVPLRVQRQHPYGPLWNLFWREASG